MKPETYYNAYRITAIFCLILALYAAWVWLGIPFHQQQAIRTDAAQVCSNHRACRAIGSAFAFNPKTNAAERKLVIILRRASSDKEAQLLFREVKVVLEKHLAGDNSTAANTMLPLEVRYE